MTPTQLQHCVFTGKKVIFLPWDTDVGNSSGGRTREETKHVVFWGQGQVASNAVKSQSSHSCRQDRRGYYHAFSPPTPQPTCLKFNLFFSPMTFILLWGWWPVVGMTQRDRRHRPGWGVGPAGLGKSQGWLTPQPPTWEIAMAFQGGSWLETSCFFSKRCLQMHLQKKNVTWQIGFKRC